MLPPALDYFERLPPTARHMLESWFSVSRQKDLLIFVDMVGQASPRMIFKASCIATELTSVADGSLPSSSVADTGVGRVEEGNDELDPVAVNEKNFEVLHSQTGIDQDGSLERVPLGSLLRGDSPRLVGESSEHAQILAELDQVLPPIVVQRSTMRVVDGMRRLQAAAIRGRKRKFGPIFRRRR